MAADYSPTVIAASLNDEELKKSIASLVSTVKTQTETMAGYMDTAVARMKAQLQSLGNISVDMGGSADGGSSRGAKKQLEEKQAVDGTTVSYQNLEVAKQKATGTSPAQDSYQEFVKNMRQNVALLSMEIKDMPNWSLDRQFGNYMQYERQIEQVRQRIQELKQELQNVASDPNSSRLVIKQITDQIAQEQQKLVQLQREQITTTRQIELADKQALAQKQSQYETEKKALVDMSVGHRERISFGERQIAQEAKITDEIRRQADEIRKSAEWKKYGTYQVYDKETNTTYQVAKSIELSLEEQILNIQKEKNKQIYQEEAEQQKQNSSLAETLNIERQITEEQGKRKKYISPTISTEMNAQSYLRFASERAGGQLLSYDELTSSSKRLGAALKQQQAIYASLTEEERQHPYGQTTLVNIQSLQRAISKLNSQMSRPISLEAAKLLPTKTLDDISYKIQMLQRYRSGIDITKQGASREIDSVNKAITELTKKQRELLGTNKTLLESNNALARSWNYMKNRLAFYFTVGASTQFVKNLIEVRSQYEMNERALGILVDSAARGTRIFNELSQMSLVSPYTLIELSSAAKQLTAYDIAAKDVVDTTRRLADMAAAVGAPVERLTYALGQMKAYGYLNSRDARMFANAGIPLVKQLAEYYSELEGKMVSAADVYDRMKKKAIDFNAVMAVVNKMTDEGGKFFDFQAKMADTLKVRLANLTLAWNNMLNAIGKDANGILTTSIKGLAELFKHWRGVSRILGTLVTTFGAYKAAVLLSTLRINASLVSNIASLAVSTRNAGFAFAFLGKAMMSVPFAGWVAAIASLVSWFYLFNQSGDDVKQKLQDIQSAFDGVRKEVDDLFADALRTESIGTQLTKLQSMLETAETELGVVIPINLEDVNESNIKQKLKDARNIIDTYLNFSQTFSEAAAGSRFNEAMNEFGSNARTVYTSISESINTVVVALQELTDKGEASKRDIEILNELTAGQKEDESRIEYLQRLISLYEELGLIGKKEYTPNLGISALWRTYNTNMDNLQAQQEQNIDRLGIKNKSVFESMLNDVQGYYSSSQGAFSQFEKQIERVAQKIDINSIPVEQRTLRLQVAINEEASLNNWNEFEKEYARQIANQKYGTQIEISSESKKDTEADLQDWQKRQQEWMDNHGIKVNLSFQTDETEASYASRMLQAAKDAQNKLEIQKRKLSVGTGSQEDVDNAIKELNEAIEKARAAGADLSQLDKKKGGSKKDILGDALTKELQLITDIQKLYKEYTKAGVDSETAKNAAAKEYQKTLEQTNATLSKFGIKGLTGEKIATMDLRTMRDTYQSILDKVQSSPKAVEELEKAIRNLNVEITKEGQKTIIDSLNNELGKLKDEYELAVELDANPELCGVFADMMGLSSEELSKLPRDFESVVSELQRIVDKEMGSGAFNVRNNLNKDVFDEWVKSKKYVQDSELVAKLKAITDYANKVRQDETKKQVEDWNKLLEKYAEYEYKRNQIIQQAEREHETARKKNAGSDVHDAIDIRKQRELAKLNFEQFQNTPTWVAATGDLAGLTNNAIGLLIDRLEQYKKSAKNLDPKQIKQINSALRKLYTEQRKGNPFSFIVNALDEAKERFDDYQLQIDEAQKRTDELNKKREEGVTLSEAEQKELARLTEDIKKWRKEQEEVGKVSAKTIVDGIQGMLSAMKPITDSISEMFAAFGNSEVSENIQKVTSVLDKAASFAAMGAQVGGAWGAAIGGVVGGLMGAITSWADEISGNASITRKIEKSQRAVKNLQNSYEELSWAADNAYGVIVSGAQKAAVENKKLQLAEMERQLELEKSRSQKRRDEDKIIELQGNVESLRREIKDATSDITNELLGISSAGDEITNLVQVMIDAFRNGEDSMEAFGKEWDKMIDNMILKLIVTQYMKKAWDNIMATIDSKQEEFLQRGTNAKAEAEAAIERAKTASDDDVLRMAMSLMTGKNITGRVVGDADAAREWLIQQQLARIEKADAEIERASVDYTEWTLDYMMHEGRDMLMSAAEGLKRGIDEYYDYGDLIEEQKLSNLQQGIQSITEDTAGSIEGYLNGISQQIYLHSSQLEEIKTLMQSFNFDVSLGTMSQILLQLQSSYQVQMTIQNTLLGWSSANGMSVRVEMV